VYDYFAPAHWNDTDKSLTDLCQKIQQDRHEKIRNKIIPQFAVQDSRRLQGGYAPLLFLLINAQKLVDTDERIILLQNLKSIASMFSRIILIVCDDEGILTYDDKQQTDELQKAFEYILTST
jgi:hypothetical protein